MARYSKSYSNYVLRKRHKTLEDGSTIFERDWGTLGERHVIETGKKRVYSDSNFLFTDNTQPGNKYRNNTGAWSSAYTKENISNTVDQTVNNTSILDGSNDIRDYAYYGSAVELVRSSIENIIKWFPGKFWTGNDRISRFDKDGGVRLYIKRIISDGHHNYVVDYTEMVDECQIFEVRNPFTIDFYTTNKVFTDDDNRLRNMPLSFKQYELNGGEILSWNVWAKPYSSCDVEYTIKYDIKFTYSDGDDVINGSIYGIVINKQTVWCTDVEGLSVQPKQDIIDKYFSELKGFEAKILNRDYLPIYTSKFITPVPYKNNNPDYLYVERSYSWPHNDYCISVDTIGFENYVSSLYELATIMDELWCDNIWRRMTHEAISNFDWTYTKEYNEGEEVDNILGGSRMEGILRIWGRCFDDIKRYVDGISLKNCVTYDKSKPNLANAELSDKVELLGWEVYSTKLNKNDNIYLDNQFVETYLNNWYYGMNPESISQNVVDNDFMNRLVLSSGEIFRTKGTKQAIEMVFGLFGIGNQDENNPEFEIEEKYYTVEPKKRDDIFYYYRLNEEVDIENYEDYVPLYSTFDEFLAVLKENPHLLDPENNPEPHVLIYDSCYDLVTDVTVGEFCEELIKDKELALNYEYDEFSGTPISDVYINNTHYIVPYFTQEQIYDGDVCFESKGGWGKQINTGDNIDVAKYQEFDYMETIPYMEILQNVGELIQVNMFKIANKKIFYVVDLSDLTEFVETIPNNISHFFKLQDPEHINNFSSWRNIPSDGNINPTYEIFNGITEDDIKLAQYNDKLSLDNFGNNPHCGYSCYDLGTEYYEYLELPFKHSIDNYGFHETVSLDAARQFMFTVQVHNGEKIENVINNDQITYYLPSKVLKIKNNIDNNCYKKYLKDIILKYVTQVIPSTTILILENFEGIGCEPTPSESYYYTANVDELPIDFSIDNCTLSNESSIIFENGINDLTVLVVPEQRVVTLTYVSGGITSTVDECGMQNCLVRINNSYVTDLPDGYKVLQYYVPHIETTYAEITLQ